MNFAKKVLVAGCLFTMLTTPMVSFATPAQTSPREGVPVVAVTASTYSNVAISKVSNYVNVRSEANTASEIVGKIYNNCAATILATVDGEGGKWYKIQSGTVTGYIKAQYFVTGAEAEKIAKEVGTVYITVNATTLRLREAPSTDSRTLTLLSEEAEYIEIGEEGDFVKIEVDASLSGYVHKDFITERVEFNSAVSVEEEAAQAAEADRIKKEAEDAIAKMNQLKADMEAERAAAENQNTQVQTETTESADQNMQNQTTEETVQTEQVDPNTQNTTTSAVQIAPGETAGPGAPMSPLGDSAPVTSEPVGTIVTNPTRVPEGAVTTAPPTAEEPKEQTAHADAAAGTGTVGSISTVGPGGTAGPGVSQNAGSAGPGVSQSTASANSAGPGGTTQKPILAPSGEDLNSATRAAIIAYAKQFLGNPYVYGGTSLTSGADCSGFTMRIYEHFGIDTGRSSRDQAAKGRTIAVSEVQPGDLIFYANGDYINHVALYIGGGQIIHASNSKTGIITSTAYYRTPYKAVTFLN